MDVEERQTRIGQAAELRRHCQHFSRMGWALLAVVSSGLVLQLLSIPLVKAVPALADQPLFFWCLSALSVYGVGFLLFYLIIRGTPGTPPQTRKPLGPVRFGQVWAISIATLYLFSLLTQALLSLLGLLRSRPVYNPVETMLDFPPIYNVLLACVLAPVCEELMFRRLLLDRLRPYGDAFAVLASALAFGLLHGNLSQFFYAFGLGCVFGYVALRTGCIFQVMILHALINALSAAFFPLAQQLGEPGLTALSLLILAALLLGVVFFVALRRDIRLAPGDCGLSEKRKWRVLFTSPGFLFFFLFCAVEAGILLSY